MTLDEELVPAVVLHLEGRLPLSLGEFRRLGRATGALHAVEADTQGPHVHGLVVGHRLVSSKSFLESAVPPIRLFLMIIMMPLKRCVAKKNLFDRPLKK